MPLTVGLSLALVFSIHNKQQNCQSWGSVGQTEVGWFLVVKPNTGWDRDRITNFDIVLIK
jgi:hypothetical protein